MKSVKLILALIIFQLGLLTGLVFFTFRNYQSQDKEEENQKLKKTLIKEVREVNFNEAEPTVMKWKEYTNYEHGFSIRHPEDAIAGVNLDGSVFVSKEDSNKKDGISLDFDTFLLADRSLEEITKQSLVEGMDYKEITLGGVKGYSYQFNQVTFIYLPSKEGKYIVISNRTTNTEKEDYQKTATQILLTFTPVKLGEDQKNGAVLDPEILAQEQIESGVEDQAKVGGLPVEEEVEEEAVQEDEQQKELIEENDLIVEPEEDKGEVAEEADDDGLIVVRDQNGVEINEESSIATFVIKDHGIEFMYPAFISNKGDKPGHKVYIFDHHDGSYTVNCWEDREANKGLFSFVISVGRLGDRTLADVAADSALAWSRMRGGDRYFPRQDKVGKYDAWYLIVERTFFYLWLPARPGEYVTISAWDQASFQLAVYIFRTMKVYL